MYANFLRNGHSHKEVGIFVTGVLSRRDTIAERLPGKIEYTSLAPHHDLSIDAARMEERVFGVTLYMSFVFSFHCPVHGSHTRWSCVHYLSSC